MNDELKTVSLIGATITGNRGAEGMLRAAVQNIPKYAQNTQFSLLSLYPKDDIKENSDANLSIVPCPPVHLLFCAVPVAFVYAIFSFLKLPPNWVLKLSSVAKEVQKSSLLVDLSGVSFMDNRGLGILAYNCSVVLLAKFLNTPLIKYAQAMGPFETWINKGCAKIFLPMVKTLVARGEETQTLLSELKLQNIEIHLCTDAAFAMTIGETAKEAVAEDLKHSIFKKDVIALSPSSVVSKLVPDYAEELASFLKYLIDEKGYGILLLAHSARPNRTSLKNNDLPICREVRDLVDRPDSLYFPEKDLNAEALRFLIGKSRFLITSRFHAMISGLSMNVPTMLIGWSHKYSEVLESFGLENLSIDYSDFSKNSLMELFQKLEDGEENMRQTIAKNLPDVINSSLNNARLAASIINS